MRPRRFTGLVLVASIALVPVAACHHSPKEGEGRLEVAGRADVLRQGGKHEAVTAGTDLHAGDQVTLTRGTGTVKMKGGTTLELRSGVDGASATKLVMGPTPVLDAGDLLVTAPDGLTLTADRTDLRVTGGSARVSSGVGVDIAGYDGDIAVDSGGQKRTIPALREMQVPAVGLPPESPHPLTYRPGDPWDRRFLSDAIDLGQRLESIAASYTSNLSSGEGRTVGFYVQVLPGLKDQPELTDDLLDPQRSPGETLVGAAITELGRRGTFAERWRSVFAFRDEGAAWGLVALDQGVDRTPLLGAVNDAVQQSPLAIGPPPTGHPTTTPPTGGIAAPPTTGPTNGGQPTTSTTQPTTTTTQPPSGGGGNGLLNPILDPVTGLLSGVLKALLGGLLGG